MKFKIWDKHNKQFLEPMAVFFGEEDTIWKVYTGNKRLWCKTYKKVNSSVMIDEYYNLNGTVSERISLKKGLYYGLNEKFNFVGLLTEARFHF